MTIKHSAVVVTIDDGSSEVGSDEWNAAHVVSGHVGGPDSFAIGDVGLTAPEFRGSPVAHTVIADASVVWHQWLAGYDGNGVFTAVSTTGGADPFQDGAAQSGAVIWAHHVYANDGIDPRAIMEFQISAAATAVAGNVPGLFTIALNLGGPSVTEVFRLSNDGNHRIQVIDLDATSFEDQIRRVFTFRHGTPGATAPGVGVGVDFKISNSALASKAIAALDAVATDVTNGSEDGELIVKVMSGGAETEVVRFSKTATATHTSLLLFDVDTGLVQRVVAGSNGSGGTGLRALAIPNV